MKLNEERVNYEEHAAGAARANDVIICQGSNCPKLVSEPDRA